MIYDNISPVETYLALEKLVEKVGIIIFIRNQYSSLKKYYLDKWKHYYHFVRILFGLVVFYSQTLCDNSIVRVWSKVLEYPTLTLSRLVKSWRNVQLNPWLIRYGTVYCL